MNITDRELLELAAKAAGVPLEAIGDEKATIWVVGLNRSFTQWNPLIDDGDALRLAVNRRIEVSHDEIGMKSFVYARAVFNDKHHIGLSEIFDDDSERPWRTRRAIVRAAAEIGKAMG